MLDVAKLYILTDATLPALAKLNFAAKVELGLQKKVGSAGGASADLQSVLKGAQQPLGALLECLFDSDAVASLSGASPHRIEEAQVVSEEPAVESPRLQDLFHLLPVLET